MDENPYKAPEGKLAKREHSLKPWLETSDYVAIVLAIITILGLALYVWLAAWIGADLGGVLSN